MKNFNLPNGTIMKDVDDPKDTLCDACNGYGYVLLDNPEGTNTVKEECLECGGSGEKPQ